MIRIENVSYGRDADLAGLEVCRVHRSRHIFPNHAHKDIYAIGLMESGGSWCLGPGRDEALVAAGQVALINPGQVHSGVPAGDGLVTYRMVYIRSHQLMDLASDISEKSGTIPEFTQIVVKDPALYGLLIRLCQRMHLRGRLEKQSFALEVFNRLLSNYSGIPGSGKVPGRERRAVRRAKEYLSENLDSKLSLQEVADVVGLSRYHFLRVFKKETGLPPHVFRTQQRIDAAQRLLKTGLPFSQVALDTGFSDQSHFTHKFRQFTGATPSQYLSVHASGAARHHRDI